jgi:hypothetical protein
MLITRAGLLKGGVRIGKIRGEIRGEGRLIVFDGENGFCAQRIHALHEILLGVQRVCRDDAQAGQESLCHRNLIGLLANHDLQKGFLALMGAK